MPQFQNFRFQSRSRQIWVILLVGVLLLLSALPTIAQSTSSGNKVDGFPVVLDGETVLRIRQGVPGVVSAAERAAIISQRLNEIANDSSISVDAIQVQNQGAGMVIKAGEVVLFTIQELDADAHHQSPAALATEAVQSIQTAVSQYRDARSIRRIGLGLLLAIFSTLTLLLLLKLLQRGTNKLLVRVRAARQADRLNWRIQNLQLLGSDATSYLLSGLIRLVRLILTLSLLGFYIPFLLNQFPVTKPFGNRLLNRILSELQQVAEAIVNYLPSLFGLVIIGWITYYAIEFAKLVISELGRDNVYPWFYSEWIEPTIRLVAFLLIAIALIVASPYLPGFGSPGFQGVSIFLGALFTLGSSSAIANAVSGLILIYTRAFRIGDVVRIAQVTGIVLEKSLFVTRLVNFKQEVDTIPNASVLSQDVTNFSAIQRESGGHLVLHTTVTLGYDLPWRKVHEVLIKAATAAPHILPEPQPFVLQTSLNDYNVSYEVNVCTDSPHLMPVIYSALHQNIQDYCNEAEIEILSPAYTSLRDGNHSTIPPNYLPDDYVSPAFRIGNSNK